MLTLSVVRGQRLERGHVPGGEVLDVDVVAHAGAVDGVVVVAEDRSFSRLPTATCAMKGIRLLGLPEGFSPIVPDSCAPTGLK